MAKQSFEHAVHELPRSKSHCTCILTATFNASVAALDVGLFSPLATYYTQRIDRLLAESQGLVHMTKRRFLTFYCVAWECAFTAKNIRSAWEATGIEPFDPDRALATIVRSNTPPESTFQSLKHQD